MVCLAHLTYVSIDVVICVVILDADIFVRSLFYQLVQLLFLYHYCVCSVDSASVS